MLSVDNHSSKANLTCPSFNAVSAAVLLITSIALVIIGTLGLFQVPGLASLNPYWYLFGLGAVVSFIASWVCCCRHICNSQSFANPSQAPLSYEQPKLPSQQPSSRVHSFVQAPEKQPVTAEDFFVLARKCVQGKKQHKNYLTALAHYEKARELGHVSSVFYIGNCFFKGKGVSKDEAKGISYFKEAAEKGHLESIFTLAVLHLQQREIDEAITWMQKVPPDDPASCKVLIDAFLAKPRTEGSIQLLQKWIECSLGHQKGFKKLERSITWRYI